MKLRKAVIIALLSAGSAHLQDNLQFASIQQLSEQLQSLQKSQDPRLKLAQLKIRQERFNEAIDQLRQILMSNPPREIEIEATFLLGKALLFSGQSDLAQEALLQLQENWPDHPLTREAAFLNIEEKLQGMTGINRFARSARSILRFEPFSVDLDFFRYYGGYNNGYSLKLYNPVYEELKEWFEHEDIDLKTRALLLDGLTRALTLGDANGQKNLLRVADSNHLYHSHLASFALMILAAREYPDQPQKVAAKLPENWAQTETGQIGKLLIFHLQAWIAGNFNQALQTLSELQNEAAPQVRNAALRHKELLKLLVQPSKTPKQRFQLAMRLKEYGALWFAREHFERLLQEMRPSRFKSRVAYELGRLLMDDLKEFKLARQWLKEARRGHLPEEYKEEIEWRLIRLMKPDKRKEAMTRLAGLDKGFAEAAIQAEIKRGSLSQSLIDKYWKTLQRMKPDAASRKEILTTLAILAEEAHQYPKARFFLEELARHDLNRARKMLEENLRRQDLFEARLQQNLSPEPERWRFEQGRALELLGKNEEARSIFESIQDRKSVYAEKARMALMKMDLGPLPYSRRKMNQLQDSALQSPDPAVMDEALTLWFQSAATLTYGYTELTEKRQEDLKQWLIEDIQNLTEHLQKKSQSPGGIQQAALIQAATTQHSLGNTAQALELLSSTDELDGSLDALKLKLKFALEDEKRTEALQLSAQLAQKAALKNAGTFLSQNLNLRLHLDDPDHERPTMAIILQTAQNVCELRPKACTSLLGHAVRIKPRETENENAALKALLQSSEFVARYADAFLARRLSALAQAQDNSELAQKAADLALKVFKRVADSSHEMTILRLMRLGGSTKNGLAALSTIARKMQKNPEDMDQRQFLQKLLADALESEKLVLKGEEGLQILDFLWKSLPADKRMLSLQALSGSDAESLKSLKQIEVWLQQNNWNMASSRIAKLLGQKSVSDILKYKALEMAHENLKTHRARKIGDFRSWLFRVNPKELPPLYRKNHQQWVRSINAEAVITSLKRDLNWDDPQNPRNRRILFQIARTYLRDKKDVAEAMNILNQIRETFRDPNTMAQLKQTQSDLVLLDRVYMLQKEPSLAARIEAADILIEELKRPTEALNLLMDAEPLAETEADLDMLTIERARIHIHRRDPDAAEAELSKLSREYSGFTASTLKQIEASRKLSQLPSLAKASARQRIAIARIHLYSFMDLKEAARVIEPLEIASLSLKERNALALLKADFYNTAMGRNQSKTAFKHLQSGIKARPAAPILARLESMAGFHAYTYDLNPYVARRHFLNSYEAQPDSPWGRLSILHLADLAEKAGKGEQALQWLKKLQSISSSATNESELEPRETALRKSLLMDKLQKHLQKLGPEDRHLVLESARALGSNPDYASEADSKYRLYLRLENDPQLTLQIRQELARFHQKGGRLKESLKEWRHIFENESEPSIRLKAATQALEILGSEMKNWPGAIAMARQASRLLLPSEDLHPIREKLAFYRQKRRNQKKVTLRNLNYSHFEKIQGIKDEFYSVGDWEGAAEAYRKLLKTTQNYQLEVGIHYELSRVLDLKLKRYEDALEHYEEFRNVTPDSQVGAEILLRIAEIYMEELRQPDEALKRYRTFIQDYPASHRLVAVQFELARLLAGPRMNYSEALDIYTDIANAYPQTDYEQKALFARANLQSDRLSDYNGAIQTYQEIINRYFDSRVAAKSQFEIARLYEVQLNREQDAINAYLELIEKWPNSDLATQARRQIDKIRNR